MSLEEDLELQDMKRDLQKHLAEEHDNLVPLSDIHIMSFKAQCNCEAPIQIDFEHERARCSRCKMEAARV